MKRYIVKFDFHHSLHLGSDMPGVGEEATNSTLHSDTLFSALCNVWAQIDWYLQKAGSKPFNDLLQLFVEGTPPFKISSGFPYIGDQFFLPRPLNEPSILFSKDTTREEYGKYVKKLSFIPINKFKEWITNDGGSEGLAYDFKGKEDTWCFGSAVVSPKTTVDRINSESNIYHTENFFFKDGCSLYAIVELSKDVSAEHFKIVLDHMKKSGIGGNRNVGQGAIKEIIFDETPAEINNLFSLPDDNGYCLISLYYPYRILPEDNVKEYDLILRKGWIGSHSVNKSLKKKTCYMFSEGSIFKDIDNGKLVDTKPEKFHEHLIWQYGYSMTIPAKKEDM